MLHKLNVPIISALAALTLSACGGGGDGDNPLSVTPPAQLATITESNAPTIAGVAAQQALGDNFFLNLTNAGIPVISSAAGAGVEVVSLARQAPLPGTAAASIPQACQISGSLDVELDVADPNMLTEGDRFIFTFDDCDDGADAVLNGGLEMTLTGLGGDPNSENFLLALNLGFDAFTITRDGDTAGASGDLGIEIDSTVPMMTVITVSASALTVTNNGQSETFTDLEIVVSQDDTMFPPAVSTTTTFGLSSPRLPGDIVVSTSIDLASTGSEFPYSGEMVVSGAANASISIIPLDSNLVRLEVDTDGDGAVDVVIDTSWVELMAMADDA